MGLAPRYLVPAILIVLTASAAIVPALRWSLMLLAPLLAIAMWDFFQRQHTLRRNFPLIARMRWLFEDLRPYLHTYIVESDLEGRPFNRDQRALVYARAKGELDKHPMGTELDTYSEEYEWLSHSIVPDASAPDYWRVRIGNERCGKPYEASLLNISAMSFGSLGGRAIEALNWGAAKGGFAHDTGEGGISRYHRSHGGDLIWEIGSGYFGCRTSDGNFDPDKFAEQAGDDQVKMIEVKLSQGAKPGHGGVLPGSKVTGEIAEARGVDVGQDCNSPPAHSTFSTPVELIEWIDDLRELSGGKPVGFKLCVGQLHEVMALMKAMIETGRTPDFIVVDGGEGGTGAAPPELSNSVGMPMRQGLMAMRNALVGCGLKGSVRLGVSGKIHSGAGLAAAFALGADWGNAARSFMFALGCVQSMRCHTDECPTGVATQQAWRQQGLVVPDKAERVYRFHRETLKSFREIVVAMGHTDPWQLRPWDLFDRLDSTRALPIDSVYEFLEPGRLLQDPENTQFARAWREARAETFRRVA